MMTMETVWWEIRTYLEEKKNRIYDEILHYPPPIPACDVQFNYLLAERARLTAELNRLRELAGQSANEAEAARLLQEFIANCEDIEAAAAARWNMQMAQREQEY